MNEVDTEAKKRQTVHEPPELTPQKIDIQSIAQHLGIPRELAPYAMLTGKQLAALLGMSESFVEKQRVLGGFIPHRRIGRSCRYMVADVVSAIEKMRFASTSQAQKEQG